MIQNQAKFNKRFNSRIKSCLKLASGSYGNILDIPEPHNIMFNYEFIHRDWLAVAYVNPNLRTIQNIVSFNPIYVEDYFEEYVEDIVPHELAHIICFTNELDTDHGENWRELCVDMGGSGEEFHKVRT